MGQGVVILGIFVADLAFRAGRLPKIGETIAGSGFKLGPGGKGSNQAVAAARAGAQVTFISKIGADDFGAIALATWQREGIVARVQQLADQPTGAAFIYVNETNGENAIIVVPGAAATITPADVEAEAETICDFVTPNESEASLLTGVPIASIDGARRAGDVFLAKGVGTALITLGEQGALLHTRGTSLLVPAFHAGTVVETAGAGDAFNGGFAAALARGDNPEAATRFGCATAGISVTRSGTAPSMPTLSEIEALLAANPPVPPA